MKRFDPNIVFGFLLLVGGGLALAQTMGYLENATGLFWGGTFLAIGLVFLTLLFGGHWWAAFPGFTLVGLGALILLQHWFVILVCVLHGSHGSMVGDHSSLCTLCPGGDDRCRRKI